MKKTKHFLSILDLSAKEIWQVFIMAKKLKNEWIKKGKNKQLLVGKQMVMLFEKPSLRTKLSFDIAISQLGGHAVYFGPREVGLGKRESVSDVSKVISSMSDLIVARVFKHQDLEELALNSKVSVINALSDLEHPCQALADLFTIWEINKFAFSRGPKVKGKIEGLKIAYVGDGENNVAHSLCLGATMLGAIFACGSPKGYWLNSTIVSKAKKYGTVLETVNPKEAVKNADIVVTDTWVSMGDTDKEKRMKIFKKYQVSRDLMKFAKKDAIFLHCLPAERGNEVSAEVIDGSQSVVFQQAENRVHTAKALILKLMI